MIGVSWVGSESDSTNLSFSDRVTVMAVSREEKATEQNSYKPFQAYMALGDYPLMRDVYVILTDPRWLRAFPLFSLPIGDSGSSCGPV